VDYEALNRIRNLTPSSSWPISRHAGVTTMRSRAFIIEHVIITIDPCHEIDRVTSRITSNPDGLMSEIEGRTSHGDLRLTRTHKFIVDTIRRNGDVHGGVRV